MSSSSRSDTSSSSSSIDLEELLNIGARCRELKKEKDLLKASHSQGYDLIKRLELYIKKLNDAHSEDKRHIQELETELRNRCNEIESLHDQLNSRNLEIDSLGKHVNSLDMKLSKMGSLQDEVIRLTEELNNSTLYIEKLEETNSSAALESQCEIETLRLEMLSLEQSNLESKRFKKECVQEKAVMRELIDQLDVQNEDAHEIIESLEQENIKMRYMLDSSQTQVNLFVKKVEELLESSKCVPSKSEVGLCGEVLGSLLLKLLSLGITNHDSTMSHQIHEYEFLVKRLREEVKEEKMKAKEESEDLAQEMAELRYQMTELLEEERNRRACIEQASLQRIAELEKQLLIERRKML